MPIELTAEDLQKAETMSLDDLRALAIKTAEAETTAEATKTEDEKNETRARGADGKFVSTKDPADDLTDEEKAAVEAINNDDKLSDDEKAAKIAALAKEEDDDEVHVVRREIPNGEGSVDVYEGTGATEMEAASDLIDKIAEGKRNANAKIQEFIKERKSTETKTAQQIKDENYLIEQKLKTNPKATIAEVTREVIAEEVAKDRRSLATQSRFVQTHPDFVTTPDNGNRLTDEFRRLNPDSTEFTSDGLEKAYQSLKKSGLLQLKAPEANDATKAAQLAAQQTADAEKAATQQRSSRKGSGISTRTSVTTVAKKDQGPSEDEAYKMPLEKLKELADKQMKERLAQQD